MDFSVKSILNAIINTKIEPVYWFFPTYFGVCLGIPVLSALQKKSNSSMVYGRCKLSI